MRCYACNKIMSTAENKRKFAESGAFTELCTSCLGTIQEVATDDEYYGDDEGFDEEESDEGNF